MNEAPVMNRGLPSIQNVWMGRGTGIPRPDGARVSPLLLAQQRARG
jgi:hypothetical protein